MAATDVFIIITLLLISCFLFAVGGRLDGINDTMAQAFERGFAVQCLGKDGYYWECDK